MGSDADNGAYAGFSYANTNNTPSNSNANIGSHLCFSDYFFGGVITLPLGKKRQFQKGIGSSYEGSLSEKQKIKK